MAAGDGAAARSPPASMKLSSLQSGPIREIAVQDGREWWDRSWRTGFFKAVQTGPQWLGYEGLVDDEQADREVHGGVDKAVCAYPGEHYAHWQAHPELAGAELGPGAFGENFTVENMLEGAVCIGDTFTVGEALVQVSQPRQPCWKLARRWRVARLAAYVEETGRTGYYFRVVRHGYVRAGDGFHLRERPCPQWTIQRCNDLMHHEKSNEAQARDLAQCSLLAGSWKDTLWARANQVRRQAAGAAGGGGSMA